MNQRLGFRWLLKTMEEVFSHNGDQHFIPASVMKSLTSAVALQDWDLSIVLSQEARYTGEITNEGVLKGNLYIVVRVIHT